MKGIGWELDDTTKVKATLLPPTDGILRRHNELYPTLMSIAATITTTTTIKRQFILILITLDTNDLDIIPTSFLYNDNITIIACFFVINL